MPARQRIGGLQGKSAQAKAGSADINRREVVLEAAAKIFATRGFSNATVRQIGDEAGMLSGSLYYWFESKDAMLEEILGTALRELTDRYGSVARSFQDPVECLRTLIITAVEWILRNPYPSTILQNDFGYIRQCEQLAWVNDKYQQVRHTWMDVLRRGIEHGLLNADLDAELAYLTIYGALLSTVRWHGDVARYSAGELAVKQADMFLAGLLRAPKSAGRQA